MREPCNWGGYSCLVRPAHNPRYTKCRAGRHQGGGVCSGVRVCGALLGLVFAVLTYFIETATSPAHHWARRSGPPARSGVICLICFLGLQCKRAHGRRVVSSQYLVQRYRSPFQS